MPIIDPGSKSFNFFFELLINTSFELFLFKKQFVFKPLVSKDGKSLSACTAISIFFSRSSSSIFLENNPFPPISLSLMSISVSPFVVIFFMITS